MLSAPVVKRSVRIAGHQTSVSMEEPFWVLLGKQAKAQNKSINQLVSEIDEMRSTNLSSAIRLYVLFHLNKT
ncbi:MAG: ribbon-helix-helix domain-containing protein [Alphaproteobacteria bacterium]|nr:ribbon-helix-helix domain-containing protein [Alphaproteobacteria bacterium]